MSTKWIAFWLIAVGAVVFFHAINRVERAAQESENLSDDYMWIVFQALAGAILFICGLGVAVYLLMQ